MKRHDRYVVDYRKKNFGRREYFTSAKKSQKRAAEIEGEYAQVGGKDTVSLSAQMRLFLIEAEAQLKRFGKIDVL